MPEPRPFWPEKKRGKEGKKRKKAKEKEKKKRKGKEGMETKWGAVVTPMYCDFQIGRP